MIVSEGGGEWGTTNCPSRHGLELGFQGFSGVPLANGGSVQSVRGSEFFFKFLRVEMGPGVAQLPSFSSGDLLSVLCWLLPSANSPVLSYPLHVLFLLPEMLLSPSHPSFFCLVNTYSFCKSHSFVHQAFQGHSSHTVLQAFPSRHALQLVTGIGAYVENASWEVLGADTRCCPLFVPLVPNTVLAYVVFVRVS